MQSLWLSSIVVCLFLLFKAIQLLTARPAVDLRHLPGTWHSKYTSIVFQLNGLVPRVHEYVDSLHRRYGPVVRVTPDMVAIADPDGVADIYRSSRGYLKGPFYDMVIPGVFSARDPVIHGQRRRLFARPLSNSSLHAFWADEVRKRVNLAVHRIKSDAETTGEGDAYKWWNIMANDIITLLSFGESLNLLESDLHLPYIDAVKNMLRNIMLTRRFPTIMRILRFLHLPRVHKMINARSKVEKYTSRAVENFRAHSRDQQQGAAGRNLFTQIVEQADKDDVEAVRSITDQDVHDEAVTLMLGGTDSTSSTLTNAVWLVLTHPSIQSKLENEIANLSEELSWNELEKARLLNAVIHETLRIRGPVSIGLQRVVPPGGARIAGFDLVPGTVVWPQMYTTSRDASIWPDPLTFDPSRFIDENLTPTQKKVYVPFGGGTRTCVGINLAYLELRFALALFFRECRGAQLSDKTTAQEMAPDNFFVSSPRGRRCLITLSRA